MKLRLSPPALVIVAAAAATLWGCASAPPPSMPPLPELAREVEIRRTSYGVPQIVAQNLAAGAFALAWVQLEDHGIGIIEGMHAARGRMALVEGEERVDADARARQRHARAVAAFPLLAQDTRDVYTGFAEGMNHFIRVHGDRLPDWMEPDFTGPDVLARDITWAQDGAMNAFRRRLEARAGDPLLLAADAAGGWGRLGASGVTAPRGGEEEEEEAGAVEPEGASASWMDEDAALNVGSNAWALSPQRTASGHAILLRNPHLSWTAGYYEAHLRVPGKVDFYGDFRIGGPFTVIGGFNERLGFATTNNESRSHEFYAFRAAPGGRDAVVVDDAEIPLEREVVEVEYRDAAGSVASTTREFWSTPWGPILHRTDSLVYVYRPANQGDFRAGEQWLEMMKARNLEEWRRAMRIQARTTSNFTYADADGNILIVWVAAAPILPHPAGGDTLAILATRSDQVWSRIADFDALPQTLNPPGGYVRNENDSPHYGNMNAVIPHDFPFWVQPPRLRLRSQHGVELLHNDRVFTLEDVVVTKHSPRMLLADRVKDDLVAAVRATGPAGETARALDLLAAWDNTASHGARGAVLFETWWNGYRGLLGNRDLHAVEWSEEDPMGTPRGLSDPVKAAEAFAPAVVETARLYGRWDVAWGEVHRVRRGRVDEPVAGCGGALGCFRVLNFETADDSRRIVNGGDGWVIAVEFAPVPRGYSVLAYGQSTNPASPWHDNQAELFAQDRMKPTLWTEADIEADVAVRYRPGEQRAMIR